MSNNSGGFFYEGGQISEIGLPARSTPGFAIPLVRTSPRGNSLFVQRVDQHRRVEAFDPFQGPVDKIRIDPVDIKLGDVELFALVDRESHAFVGDRQKLARVALRILSQVDDPILRLSLAQFADDKHSAREAARAIFLRKVDQLGSDADAASWFVRAVIAVEVARTVERESKKTLTNGGILSRVSVDQWEPFRYIFNILEVDGSFLSKNALAHVRDHVQSAAAFVSDVTGRKVSLNTHIGSSVAIKEHLNSSSVMGASAESKADLKERIMSTLSDDLGLTFERVSDTFFSSEDGSTNTVVTTSKYYERESQFWYAFHTSWEEFLLRRAAGYFVLGCRGLNKFFAIPISTFVKLKPHLSISRRDRRTYWHLHVRTNPQMNYEVILNGGDNFDLRPYTYSR